MSDILIKGMEMPDCCYGCPLSYDMGEGNYACQFFNGYAPIEGRRDDCPLVEVKPHGDLIDRLKLATTVADLQQSLIGKEYDSFLILGDVLRLIDLSPVVLEASE